MFFWDFSQLQFPTKSVMEPRYPDGTPVKNPDTPWYHMPKQPEPNGAIIRHQMEVLHWGSPKVFKTVMMMQQEKLEVKIDRRCLFAFDVINGMFVASPQQAGITCPCCNNNQEQWDLEQNIGKRNRNVGTGNQGFITTEQSELRQIQRLKCAIV